MNMVNAIMQLRQSQIKSFPHRTNRASEIGHPCLRYLVLNRTSWDKVEPHGPHLQGIFNDGHAHEKQVIIELLSAGVEIFEQQLSLEDEAILKEANISGHIDFKVKENDNLAVPVDVKSASQYSYDSVNSYSDMVNSEKIWVMKYPGQLQIYMLATNSPHGYFLYKNKNNSQMKEIKVELDFSYAEELIQKGHKIEAHLKAGTLPDRIPYSQSACDGCKHVTTCNPEIPENYSLYFLDKPEFLEKVRRWEAIEATGQEYNKLNKEIKDHLKATGKLKIGLGEFLLQGKVMANDGMRWTRERITTGGIFDDGVYTGNCKVCNEKLDVSDSILLDDHCTSCLEKGLV